MSLNILLVSDQIIKDRTSIHSDIDPKLIYPDIKCAQDMYIHPKLGSALFNKLLNDIKNNSLSGDYKTLVDDYIIDTLMWYVLMELPTGISFQFWNKGVVRKQGENTELPSMDELVSLSNGFKIKAEFYGQRLINYLQQNAPTKFPEYLNPGSGIDDIRPENKAFTMPMWLDDCDCDNRTYEQKYQGNRPNCCD